jgi:hypothetical protein
MTELQKAKANFKNILTAVHEQKSIGTFTISTGLLHLTLGLEEIEAKLDRLLKAQQLK